MAILTWIKTFFMKNALGIVLQKLIKNSAAKFASEIFNKDNQQKAYEFVKELATDSKLSNAEKALKFNEKMFEWGKKAGKILENSIINCLREMAVTALKDEQYLAIQKEVKL